MAQTRIPSLRSMATCLLYALASVSAAPPPPPHRRPLGPPGPPASHRKSPFRTLQSVPTGSSLSPIITGLYANDTADAQIVIHDMQGAASWTWTAADAAAQASRLPADLLRCIQSVTAVPEAKWADGGCAVLTIYNAAALLITHAPGTDADKQVTWGVCLDQGGGGMTNTHSLELVPDGLVAIATTTASTEATIQVFNVSTGLTIDAGAAPVQSLNLLPAVHALVWDERGGLLWGAGSSADPTGASGSAAPALNGYRYTRGPGGGFATQPTYSYNVTAAAALDTEWAGSEYNGWWDGGHDMTGVPGRRQLLLSTDTDLHVFDIDSQTFESGSAVATKYLPGFAPVDSRVGADGQALPRSDVKSLSVDGSHNVLYVQAAWQGVTSYQINLLQDGQLQPVLTYPQELYRSRWFADTPTWPKARLPPP